MTCVLILGSGPTVTEAAHWPRAPFDHVVAINNAHAVRPDWTHHIYPWDFPEDRRPQPGLGQTVVTQTEFVPAQNAFGGFVYAGGTMAFTTAYWALHALKPRVIAAFGCDMHYPKGKTHFYGAGTADPLRPDITLQSLEAKSARLMILAAMEGCAMVNLSFGPSRLIYPRVARDRAAHARPQPFDLRLADEALKREDALGYHVPSGRYWEEADRFDAAELRRLDMLWLAAARAGLAATA
jgi:hypothetical protein